MTDDRSTSVLHKDEWVKFQRVGQMSTEELRVKSLYDRLLDRISQITMIFSGVALVFMTVIFGWLVFGRYVLNSTPTWVEQVSLLLIVYIGFLGAAVGVHRKTHLGVSVFWELSPEPIRRIFDFSSYTILLVFGLIMVVYGYKLTIFKWDSEIPLLHISEGWRALPIMLSGIFVFLASAGHLVHFFKRTNRE
jgi:TRAP-type C4-dicarboxylate transport system permease small subunit